MFSNITSYLFGSYQAADNETPPESIDFHEVELEDDWMVVDRRGELKENCNDMMFLTSMSAHELDDRFSVLPLDCDKSRQRRSSSCRGVSERDRNSSVPLRHLSPSYLNSSSNNLNNRRSSRSSSKSSSQCYMDESWYITPPPCFVSGPYETKPSSLENLLIEQPGLILTSHVRKPETAATSKPPHPPAKPATDKKAKKLDGNKLGEKRGKLHKAEQPITRVDNSNPANANLNDQRRKLLLEIHEEKKFINVCNSQLNAAQKLEQKVPNQFLRRNQMDRLNKVQHELSSRKKRQRRADLNKKHSGVNNNRKCCY